jgi:hypothetical protein
MMERLIAFRSLLGIVLGGGVGYAMYRFVGCSTGACPLTSNPWMSVFFWAVIGALIASG